MHSNVLMHIHRGELGVKCAGVFTSQPLIVFFFIPSPRDNAIQILDVFRYKV